MRTGEVFALTWDDIDLENRIIKINKTVYAKDKEENSRWYLGTTKTIGSSREVYICDTLYSVLSDYKNLQVKYKKEYGKKYKRYTLKEIKNKYGKLVEYKIIKSNSKRNRVEMVFTRKDGTYSGTDIIRYPFRIIPRQIRLKTEFFVGVGMDELIKTIIVEVIAGVIAFIYYKITNQTIIATLIVIGAIVISVISIIKWNNNFSMVDTKKYC